MPILNLTFISDPSVAAHVARSVKDIYCPQLEAAEGLLGHKLLRVAESNGVAVDADAPQSLAMHLEFVDIESLRSAESGVIEAIRASHASRYGEAAMIFSTLLLGDD